MATKITLFKGDLTRLEVDAIVNAANEDLYEGGGVCGAIFRAGGSAITRDCDRIRNERGKCATGDAVITAGGNLPARQVIHAVGPVWHGGNQREKEMLAKTYHSVMDLAEENQLRSIAFPNISTGIYGFPKKEAAKIAVETVRDFASSASSIEEIIFCCIDEENYDLYRELLNT